MTAQFWVAATVAFVFIGLFAMTLCAARHLLHESLALTAENDNLKRQLRQSSAPGQTWRHAPKPFVARRPSKVTSILEEQVTNAREALDREFNPRPLQAVPDLPKPIEPEELRPFDPTTEAAIDQSIALTQELPEDPSVLFEDTDHDTPVTPITS